MTNKTQPNSADPESFIRSVANATRRADAFTLLEIYQDITSCPPVMWGESLIGFGQYHYKYASGREGDFMKGGFSPRKANLSIYLMQGVERYQNELKTLGPYKNGRACLYLGALKNIDIEILKTVIAQDFNAMTARYG